MLRSFTAAALSASAIACIFSVEMRAHAAGVCIDEKARQSVDACSGAGPHEFARAGGAPAVSFHGAPPSITKPKQEAKRPPAPVEDPNASERRSKARQLGLLVTEIAGIESLLATTPRGANDRATILRRLADDYVELENAAFREKTLAEVHRDEVKKQNGAQAGQIQSQVNQDASVMKAARQKAIANYATLKTDYPQNPLLDEVLYFLAYEYEQASDEPNARKAYYELISRAPSSKYVPQAYLAFGDSFFNEAQGDPSKFGVAAQAYMEVLKYPAPQNRVFGYAHYKLGYVFWNQGDYAHALSEFKKTIDFGAGFSQLPGATKLAENARHDLIPVYALSGDPDKSYHFFKGVSGDAGGVNDKTFRMMDELGNAYLDTGHYPEAISLYRDLLARDRGPRACTYHAHVVEATMAMKASDKDAIALRLDEQMKIERELKANSPTSDATRECSNKTAALVTETAMAYHVESLGTEGQRGTGDQKTMGLAATLYKKASLAWTKADYASFQFPGIIKADWPTLYKIRYAMADILYSQERWAECGPAFDAVLAEDPNSPEAAEAAYASSLCYQKLYEHEHAHGEDRRGAGQFLGRAHENASASATPNLNPKNMSETEHAMIGSFDRYVCTIKPPANDAAGQKQLCEVKYARARTYFEAQHWDEAAAAFRDIALHPCDEDLGVYASQLYLESANILATHPTPTSPARPSCFASMREDVTKFAELYCAGDKATKNAESCKSLNIVSVDLERKVNEHDTAELDKLTGPIALSGYEKVGNSYFEMFRRYCQDPILNGNAPQAEKCDELAYNAAKSFQAARLVAKAISVRKALLEFDARTGNHSIVARKATYEIGSNYQAIAVYELAAEWFEKYEKADPKGDKADVALSDAVVLRLGLGQEHEAIADAAAFNHDYGLSKARESAQIAYAVGAHYAQKEEWDACKRVIEGALATIDRAPLDIRAQAHATLGRAYSRSGGAAGNARAAREFEKVTEIFGDDADAKIRAAYASEDVALQDKRVMRTLDAAGEAIFFVAEGVRKRDVDKLVFPAYRGSGTLPDVKHHIDTRVKPWYLAKMAAIQKVEPAYAKILDMKPVPPPKWVIASSARAGAMWGDFIDDFRRAPIPKAWKGTDLEVAYQVGVYSASEPFKADHARPALEKCLKRSVEFHYFDELSRSCEVWLAKNYPKQYVVVDELRSAPTLANSALEERAPPVPLPRVPGKIAILPAAGL